MKKIFFFILIILSTITKGQVDTVCYHTNGSTYQVTNTAGYTYTWTVASPGIITGGQGTNSIIVDWSNANAGLITNGISVYATNTSGCQTIPVDLDVFIFNIIPTITPIGPFCISEPCVNLVGTPIGGSWSGNGISTNQFCPTVAGSGQSVITYTISQSGCVFLTTTNTTVNQIPTISQISHN